MTDTLLPLAATPAPVQPCILGLPFDRLPQPASGQHYRRQQLADWLFVKGARQFSAMTNLPADWRDALARDFCIDPFVRTERFLSRDGSVRYLFTLPDHRQTEAVYMPYANRKTVCLSSMVGCPAGCSFCATGALGFGRNLSVAEIIGQLMTIAWHEHFSPREIRNVVLMGMGEALLNYDNALTAIRMMIDPRLLDMSARRITLSTVGLPKRIMRLADEGLPLVLAVSLHAPDETTRREIIPTAQAYPIPEIIAALHDWQAKLKRRVTIEYTMLAGVNDALWQAELLAAQLTGLKSHVNLIPFNPWQASPFRSSSRAQIARFKAQLETHGLSVSVRFSRSQDTGGACGQLALTQQR